LPSSVLAEQVRLWIRLRFVPIALLQLPPRPRSPSLHRRVLLLPITLLSRPPFHQFPLHPELFLAHPPSPPPFPPPPPPKPPSLSTASRNSRATSPPNSRSRFLLNVLASHTGSLIDNPTNHRNPRCNSM